MPVAIQRMRDDIKPEEVPMSTETKEPEAPNGGFDIRTTGELCGVHPAPTAWPHLLAALRFIDRCRTNQRDLTLGYEWLESEARKL